MQVERGYLNSGAALIVDALDHGGVVVLGPAGSGRTTLLTDLATIEARRGRKVQWCCGRRHGAPTGEAGAVTGEPERLLDLVRATPTTLMVDDAHLLDDPMLRALSFVAERRGDFDLRMVVGRRAVRARPSLAYLDLAVTTPGCFAHLGPLDEAAVAAWLHAIAAARPALDASDLHDRTGGWPDLVATLADGGTATDDPIDDLVRTRLALVDAEHHPVLTALAFGLAPGSASLSAATGADHAAVDRAIEAGTAEGLLHGTATPVPAVARALRAAARTTDRTAVARAALTAPGADRHAVAAALAALGDRSPEAAELYELTARDLVDRDPLLALELFERAVAGGCSPDSVAAARAEAALAAGQPEQVLTTAHAARGVTDAADRARLTMAVGGAWAHLGRPDLAAGSYRSAISTPSGACAAEVAAQGAVAQAGSRGEVDEVDDVTATTRGDAGAEGLGLLADAALAWVAGDVERALVAVQRSARVSEAVGGVGTWLDSPHAVGALLASHQLDGSTAAQLATRAAEHGVGGAAFEVRHQLLAAWAALRAGLLDDARDAAGTADPRAPRDVLVKAAVDAAVALRVGAPEDLVLAQKEATAARAVADLDLFSVDLAVELAHLAARTGADPDDVLAPFEATSAQAGEPAYLAVSLAWARLLIATLVEDAEAASTAAAALERRAPSCPAARVLAPAAVAFSHVLSGAVHREEVIAATSLLARHGLGFEASRLAGAAGLRCSDPAAARALLAESRRLRGSRRPSQERRTTVEALSDREREVAQSVLEGKSHREIGAALFISAKTVEHHVARIRQKVGAKTRSELMAAIREELSRP